MFYLQKGRGTRFLKEFCLRKFQIIVSKSQLNLLLKYKLLMLTPIKNDPKTYSQQKGDLYKGNTQQLAWTKIPKCHKNY